MAAQVLGLGATGVNAGGLVQASELVARASGRAVAPNKSIVGAAVFTHESGIHVDGLLKDARTYEPFPPAELGRRHTTVLGKHSGAAGVRAACSRLGLPLADDDARALLERVRAHAARHKRPPRDNELMALYRAVVGAARPGERMAPPVRATVCGDCAANDDRCDGTLPCPLDATASTPHPAATPVATALAPC
jgi:homocitrate synthase NifV